MAHKNLDLTLTIVERPNLKRYTDGNRFDYKAVIQDYEFHVASFRTLAGMAEFIKHFGLHLEHIETIDSDKNYPKEWHAGIIKRYKVRERFNDARYFYSREEVPEGATPIKLLSNGAIVDGYTLRDGDVINIYRPNPNADKSIYNPLELSEHIEYQNKHFIF